MNESHTKYTVIVGIFVFAGLVLLVLGIFMVGNIHDTFKQKLEVISIFDDVNGLEKGNNVWFSGVKIGTVNSLHFFGRSQVAVSVKIDIKHQQYIRKNAKVKISADGLIGKKILVIYGGTPKSGAVQEGDTLAVEKTFSSEEMLNMLQENNKNVLAITTDFKSISKNLAAGEGSIGKLLKDDVVYNNINATTASLQKTAAKADQLINSLVHFSARLNKKGTLANELTSDTLVFSSVKTTVVQLQHIADTARVFMAKLKEMGTNPDTPVGVLTQNQEAGTQIKAIIKNLEGGSEKLAEDLEAVQHNFLLRGFFKKKAKKAKLDSLSKSKVIPIYTNSTLSKNLN